eukprot:4675233-Pleurochrysis_carterae.AAC.1
MCSDTQRLMVKSASILSQTLVLATRSIPWPSEAIHFARLRGMLGTWRSVAGTYEAPCPGARGRRKAKPGRGLSASGSEHGAAWRREQRTMARAGCVQD